MNRQKAAVILAGWLVLGSSYGEEGNRRFEAALSGTKVTPGPVTTAMRGKARFAFATDFSRMAYRLKVRNGAGITSAQLHCAPTGGVGPVVADLLSPVTGGWNGRLDIASALTNASLLRDANCAATIGQPIVDLADLAAAMAARRIYVDVRSAAFPEGEIRGQVRAVPANTPTPQAGTGTPDGGIQIIGSAPPPPPPAVISVAPPPGSVSVPITPTVPFLPPSFPGTATVVIPATTFTVPITVLGSSLTGLGSASATLTIPGSSFGIPIGSGFGGIPAASLLFPPPFFNPLFNPPSAVPFNPPPSTGLFSGSTTLVIPTASFSIPMTIRPVAAAPIPATAVLTIPGATWPLAASLPGLLPATLAISRIGRF